MRGKITLHHGDCLSAMAKMPDNAYDLAIVDPPYGIGADNPSKKPEFVKQRNGTLLKVNQFNSIKKEWDSEIPDKKYFNELKRVSNRQIIWGANYFGLSGGVLVWDKLNGESDQYDAEIASLSWTKEIRTVYYMWCGMFQGFKCSTALKYALTQKGNKKLNESRIHPTQKPVQLYKWLLQNYAKPGDTILDTHGGSMSIAIAAYDMGYDLDLWEIDKDYFDSGKARLERHQAQGQLF